MRISQSFIFTLALLMLVLSGCGKEDQAQATFSGDLAVIYSTLEEITNDSELVVEVRRTSIIEHLPEYGGANFSLTDVEVKEVIKGIGSHNGRIIRIFSLDPANLTKEGGDLVLFLHKYEGPVTSKEAYVISGVYQGKFEIDKNRKINYNAAKYGGVVTFQEKLNHMNLERFKASIKEI